MNADPTAPVWRALADPTRRAILDRLRERPRTTGELAGAFPLSRFAVMKHLGVLVEAGLVLVRREGRERWNHLNAVPLQQAYERWLSPYAAAWSRSLLGLKRHLEHETEASMQAAPAGEEVRSIEVRQELRLKAPRERVFDAIVNDMDAWWGAPHLFDRERARAIVLEPRVGGRWFEDWGDGEGVLWGTVSRVRAPDLLELNGPLSMGVVVGVISFELTTAGDQTVVQLSHRAVGAIPESERDNYVRGWAQLLEVQLRAFVERGERLGLRRA